MINPWPIKKFTLIQNVVNTTWKSEIDILFEREMYETSPTFRFFEHGTWHSLFNAINPGWNNPAPVIIGCDLITTVYEEKMEKIIGAIRKRKSAVFGTGWETDRLSKYVWNVIINVLCPLFIEYFSSGLKRGTTINVVGKAEDLIKQFDTVEVIPSSY